MYKYLHSAFTSQPETKTETLLSSVSLALVLGGTCTTKSGRGEDEAQAASASSIAADLPTHEGCTAPTRYTGVSLLDILLSGLCSLLSRLGGSLCSFALV